jgi:hypothetical protein
MGQSSSLIGLDLLLTSISSAKSTKLHLFTLTVLNTILAFVSDLRTLLISFLNARKLECLTGKPDVCEAKNRLFLKHQLCWNPKYL